MHRHRAGWHTLRRLARQQQRRQRDLRAALAIDNLAIPNLHDPALGLLAGQPLTDFVYQ